MANIDQIMVANGDGTHTEEVSFEKISDGGGFNPDSFPDSTTTPVDTDLIISKESGGWVKKSFTKMWDWIKGKLGISSSGSTSKYLNEKGGWSIPPNDNTTYTFATGDSNGQIKVTPSSGTAQNVDVKGLGTMAYMPNNKVKDVGNATDTTFAYSKAGLGYGDFTWLAGWNGYELRGVNKNLFAPVRSGEGQYTSVASYYSGGTAPTYIRIKFPDAVASVWFMLNMEILIRQNYASDIGGSILINAHHGASTTWDSHGKAFLSGNLSDINVYASDGKYIYIKGIGAYTNVLVKSMLVGDTARSTSFVGNVTIDYVSALPSTYQTFAVYTDVNSSNISSQSVNYATSAGSAGSATKASQDSGGYALSVSSTNANTTIGGSFTFKKYGRVVVVTSYCIGAVSAAGTLYQIATIPSGYRPTQAEYLNVANAASNGMTYGSTRFTFAANGAISMTTEHAGYLERYGTFAYII